MNGEQICKTDTFDKVPDVHINFDLNCRTKEIPKNSKIAIEVYAADEKGDAKKLIEEWTVSPNEFNTGLQRLTSNIQSDVNGAYDRNELFADFRWSPYKQCMLPQPFPEIPTLSNLFLNCIL